jgi:eukaryotic-like serine/threonine-protein kinase
MTEEWSQISPGQVIDGKYRITRLLGTGGMGAVYEGENVRIRRKVAIKMLHLSVSTQADVVKRFEREAQASALVGSEHICEVLDLGVLADGTRYMVMEYLDGETLSGRIKRHGRLLPHQAIPLLLQILEALGAAHAAGIIHRDLKPDNVFILPQRSGMKDFIKILDFGVSKFAQTGGEEMNVTRAGAVVGTPYYMSPEQAKGSSAIDARTDVYAIGVLLYQATTGQVPYQAETFNELLFKIVLEVAPPPQVYVPDIDPEFAGIIMRAMAREPEQRYQSCAEFASALQSFTAARSSALPAPPPAPPPNRPPATQVLDLAQMPPLPAMAPQHIALNQPSSPSWPGNPPMVDPTMPMQASPLHANGPAWAQVSGSGTAAQPPAPGSPSATGASWGNASTASAPRSKTPMILGAIGVVALVAVGAIVLVVATGKPKTGAASTGGVETAAPASASAPLIVPPPPSAAAPIETASAAPIETAIPIPSAVPTTKPGVTTPPTSKSSKPVVKPPTTPTTKPGKPTKPGDLGY